MAKKSKEHGNAQREKAVQAPAPVEQPDGRRGPREDEAPVRRIPTSF